ncbi:unnamed protein product [Nippostrongylus brasiliensis]|uniref:PH domain-containing protein n=1 Tax=Nippostrongylus brasiliensis TaxID=27835 RepID=A0A0N4YRG4_NIPBR|nr:unnamed protein product [Nippostrongylus brasiliensis]
MSTIGYQEDLVDPLNAFDLAKGQKRYHNGRHLRKGDALRLQKLSDRAVVYKALHDPADTLSKREKKRLQKAGSTGSLDLDVQYSLNKQQRWKTVNTDSMLNSQCESEPEVIVVDRVITPSHLSANQALNVMNVFVKEGDAISKLSTKGKGHKLRHFEVALRERREIDKDEVQPARILYNVVQPHPVPGVLLGKTQRKNTKGTWTTKSRQTNYLSDGAESESDPGVEDDSIATSAPSSSFTLADFVVGATANTKSNRSPRRSVAGVQDEELKKKLPTVISQIKSPAHSIPSSTCNKSLFEVIDVNAKLLCGMKFHEAIAFLEQERLSLRWVDENKVMIDASYLVKNAPEEPVHQPILVLFFELHENGKVLRVRINTNIQYKTPMDSEALISMVKRQKDFLSLFNSILDFIRSLRVRNLDIPAKETRFNKTPANFSASVNGHRLAVEMERMQRCDDYEMQRWLRAMYDAENSVSLDMPKTSFRHLQSDEMVFSKCPPCALNVMFRNDGNNYEEKSLICPECTTHWCRLCSSEPHWPMKCEEYRQWSEKWEQQYYFDKFCMQPDEELLRITCQCGRIYILPSGSAHNTICQRCKCRYDKTGMMCYDYACWPYYPRLRKERDAEGKPKDGYKVDVEIIPRVKLIAKDFATACTEVRNQRFDKKKRLKFEELALAAEKVELVDLRKTALILVENCTAWVYMHRSETHLRECKSSVSHLFQQFEKVELELERQSPTLAKEIDELESAVENVIRTFCEHARSRSEEE